MIPIEEARNIGPVTGEELRACGMETLEDLIELGLEESFYRLVEKYPNRLNLNCIVAMYAAIEDIDWRSVESEPKEKLRKHLEKLKIMFKRGLL